MDHSIGRGQGTGDACLAHFIGEIESKLYREDPWTELGELAIALEEDPNVDRILMDRPEAPQMFDDRGVDLTHPARVSTQQVVHGDSRNADVRLVDRGEFPFTVRAHPTCHAAD